ncbi:MAG: protein translocase subunit SecD [Anaerolineae bacterium]|nr:MAG: protein translocase subunit SecD [Anaerolineae bacterium]
MIRNLYTRLFLIALIAAVSLWIDLNDELRITNPFTNTVIFERNIRPRLGLDLRGGLQVLLEADLPPDQPVDAEALSVARTILENRTNALGVAENVLQVAGERRIVGEFPGVEDAQSVIETLKETGLLEFVDTGDESFPPGTVLQTDFGGAAPASTEPAATETPATAVPATESANATETPPVTETPLPAATEVAPKKVYHTVMTGRDLKSVSVIADQIGGYQISFELSPEGTKIFGDFTSANVGKYLTIVLDKKVISSPIIKTPITNGKGVIQGNFTAEQANALAVQLRYGALPIPLKIVETRLIGPTLGEDSLRRSLMAGLIGMVIVIAFMAIYYRLPGITADISILFYAAIAFALFKFIPVTLTLPGVAGFLLSTGSALDANILVFERLKEELRAGRNLVQAFDQAWIRAWPSIRDSNAAALITSAILFWFGSTFGATIVKGFALTLSLGVIISVFTALYITRALLAFALQTFKPTNLARWIGI